MNGPLIKYEKRNKAIISELENRIIEARARLVEIEDNYNKSTEDLISKFKGEVGKLTEENRRLTELAAQKASRADELFEMLSALSNDYSELLDKSINYIGSHGTSTHAQAKILLSKIKQESNDE